MIAEIAPIPTIPDQLLGPYGLLVGALILIVFIGRELFKFIRELIASKDAQIAEMAVAKERALKGWQDQTEANKVLAEAQASRNRDDEMRHRLEDAKAPVPRGTRRD